MGLDLAAAWMLAFFGACAAGGVVGFLLNKLIDFEFGLGVGLLIPGAVSLFFTAQFVAEYLDFRDAPARATGTVVAVEARAANAAGDITTPVAIVEWTASDGTLHRTDSKGGSSLAEGESVAVVYDLRDPSRAKVAVPDELFGGAIASGLFGTFPASAGLFFLLGWLSDRFPRKQTREQAERAARVTPLVVAANALIFFGLVGSGLWNGTVLEQVLIAFGIASLGLWMYVVDGIWQRRDPKWTLVMGVLAVNFSAWVAALWLLRGLEESW
jgi:hypothetical protein